MVAGMAKYRYAMVVEPGLDRKGREYFCAWFPDLPGCATMGSNWEHLHKMAQEAISLYLWSLDESNQPIPQPSTRISTVLIDVEKAIASQRPLPRLKSVKQAPRRAAAAAKNGAARRLTVRGARRTAKR
jgi:predicted RNase H-like HicB family nuclease